MFAHDNLHLIISNGEQSQNRKDRLFNTKSENLSAPTNQVEQHRNPSSNIHNNIHHLLVLRYPDGFVMKLSPQAARAIEALITGYSDQSFWIIARLARIRYLNDPQQINKPASPLLFFQAADDLRQSKVIAPLPRHLKQKRFFHPNPLATLNQKGALDPDT